MGSEEHNRHWEARLYLAQDEAVWNELVKDFPAELSCLDAGLEFLASCVWDLIDDQPVLSQLDIVNRLKQADSDTKCQGSSTILLAEASERLQSARVLLLGGHQSRALSCVRDAFECLRWSDVCLKDEHQAYSWLQGKKGTARRDHSYPQELSDAMDKGVQKVLNKRGTHAYIDACLLSALAIPPGVSGVSMEGVGRHPYEIVTQQSLAAILHIIGLAIQYTLKSRPALRQNVPDERDILARI